MNNDEFANDVGREGAAASSRTSSEVQAGRSARSSSVWHQPHLRRVTLDQMKRDAASSARPSTGRSATAGQRKDADDKLMFAVIAIGLGLVSALPTAVVPGSWRASPSPPASPGAGLALYQVGQEISAFSLATAANATDFDKAKAISHKRSPTACSWRSTA